MRLPIGAAFGGIALWASVASAEEDAAVEDWQTRTRGLALMIGGGAEALAFPFYPSAGLGFFEVSLNVRLAAPVDFRLTGMLAFGGGAANDAYLTLLPAARVAFRFHPDPHYTIWLGYEARAGFAGEIEDTDEIGVLGLHGPDLSLASFRFGKRGEFEIDHDGGAFLPPYPGYHFGLAFRTSFEK